MGLGFWEMDLDEEGRTKSTNPWFWEMDLDEEERTVLGFWGLEEGSGTVDGERKKKRMRRKKMTKIES